MSHVKTSLLLELPIGEAWVRLRQLDIAHHYVPGIIDTRITTPEREGVGASRQVFQTPRRFLQETVTEWQEGRGFTLRLHKGERDAPFRNARFTYALAPEGQHTRLTTTLEYTPPLGPVGPLLDALLLNRVIGRAIRDVALSLKHYYETGHSPTHDDLKRLRRSIAD